MNAVELESVTKRFGKHLAVDELSFTAPEGVLYGFIGPNGSGKTTTMRMILRIYQPDSGRVCVLGRDHGAVADDRLGYLPEERGLYKRMKVGELLTYYARLKGCFQCRELIDHWLKRLGAESWYHQRIDSLSKGMAQKVQFISAVVARPKIVILDEPFSGLDPVNMQVLQEAVLELKEQGVTIILSTHDMDVAQQMCDRLLMIFRGKKVLDGTLDSIQREHHSDEIRVRLEGGGTPEPLDGVVECLPDGPYSRLRLESADRRDHVLNQLTARGGLEHFEVRRPTLRDIFVRIAGGDADQEATENSLTPAESA